MSKETANKFDCELLAEGKLREVWLCKKRIKLFGKADEKMTARALAIIARYCDVEKSALKQTSYKTLRRYKRGDESFQLKEFKADQLRLYGFEEIVNGDEIFVVVEIDPQKKQDRASPRKLESAERSAWKYLDKIKEHHG